MNEQDRLFERRVSRIHRAHANRSADAYIIRPDGLMVPTTPRTRLRFHFPWRALLTGFVVSVIVKSFLIFYFGQEGYVARMTDLLEGSRYQQAAAFVLLPDPVSVQVAEWISLGVAKIDPV